ncbi:MAG: IS701 family transposase [Alphaproteobacteria bacterium]
MDLRWDDAASAVRFEAYIEDLAGALGHKDRDAPFRRYCAGLLLPGDRKSVEPMAARLSPGSVSAEHQSLLHFVGQSPWCHEALLAAVRGSVLPALAAQGPVEAWIVDDTGFPKKGRHSVGVARQYCGQLGKQDNCQVAVSLSLATAEASLPVAWRLYLPESWAEDRARRVEAKVPDDVVFRTKPEIALHEIARAAASPELPQGVVLADAGYGNDTGFRGGLGDLGLDYVVGIASTTTLWAPGTGPLPPKASGGRGRPATRLRRRAGQAPVSAKALAESLSADAWQEITWREGTAEPLRSRFAALRLRPAHRDSARSEPWPEEWLLIEWPEGEAEPTRYWLSNLPEDTRLARLVHLAKLRWLIERDYRELKQELGLGHYEGRGWPGFHHHAALCIAAYGFLLKERLAIPPSGPKKRALLKEPSLPRGFRPRGAADPPRTPPAGLHRHTPPPDRHGSRPQNDPMSMLSAETPRESDRTQKFMTQ